MHQYKAVTVLKDPHLYTSINNKTVLKNKVKNPTTLAPQVDTKKNYMGHICNCFFS